MFLRKGVLKICNKFTGEHPCGSVISIKLLCKASFKRPSNVHSFPINLCGRWKNGVCLLGIIFEQKCYFLRKLSTVFFKPYTLFIDNVKYPTFLKYCVHQNKNYSFVLNRDLKFEIV